jgi:hypothetical protein
VRRGELFVEVADVAHAYSEPVALDSLLVLFLHLLGREVLKMERRLLVVVVVLRPLDPVLHVVRSFWKQNMLPFFQFDL